MANSVEPEKVEKPKVQKFGFSYYSTRPPYWGLDGVPFGALYAVVFSVVIALAVQEGDFLFKYGLLASFPVVLHVVLFLLTQWSVEVMCTVKFKKETNLENATHVKVERLIAAHGKAHAKRVLLAPIERSGEEVSIVYLKKKFGFNKTTGQFERLKFDITSPLGTFLSSVGLTEHKAKEITKKYGINDFEIPLPTFGELFMEHAVAPFFVFQVVCVILWLMDEYWYYSLLTLFMLIILEAQMVQKRIGDLSELREMRIPPRPMQVLREGNWRGVQSDQLLPGDIVALMRKADVSCPVDVLLLQGSVLVNEAMLTGEGVPQMKVAAMPPPDSPELAAPLDMKGLHKTHIVSAGTNIMLHQNTSKLKTFKKVPATASSPAAVGYVLRTGFDTTQGKLCRTILFSAERVTVSSREALYFLLILVFFALGAVAYVLYDGLVLQKLRFSDYGWPCTMALPCTMTLPEPERSTFKLFLAVSHILTSVVPPEFPIMLSLAVNLSLVALVQKRIYCTEPFRVPLAGKVDTACFDKTGTLTSDSMEVEGVRGLADFPPPKESKKKKNDEEEDGSVEKSLQPLPFLTTAVMSTCSGLMLVEGEIVGDPLEKAALEAVKWQMISPDMTINKTGKGGDRLQVLRRYPFVSELQRMTVLVKHVGPGNGFLQNSEGEADQTRVLALVKGSCEALRPRLKKEPDDLAKQMRSLTKSGLRVLCLAAKEVSAEIAKADPEEINRQDLESDLEFCGLLVLKNSVKQGTMTTVKQLRRSYHRVIMITGDHPLTACQVARNVAMADRPFFLLEPTNGESNGDAEHSSASSNKVEWRSDDDSALVRPFDTSSVAALARERTLCMPGRALALLNEDELCEIAPFVTVFARVSPQQKEQVIVALNKKSHTMMVGDGTNDVGALKHAHVGISLLTGDSKPPPAVAAASQARRARQPQGMQDMDNGGAPLVRLGDASIASPFTYKGDSVKCSIHTLKCGRATLSTVLMMYKIMGLNSIMSAFAMSALTLDGVKLGDGQTAVESVFVSACFFLVSRSRPAKNLAKQMPTCSVFAWNVLLSLGIQLVVHLSFLYYGWTLANTHRAKDFKRNLEGDFEPNLTNTVVFLMIATMHGSSFLANYEGHPFMMPFTSNKALMYSLGAFMSVIVLCASEVLLDLNELLSLVPSPNEEFRNKICMIVVGDIVLSVSLAKSVDWLAIWMRGRAAEERAQALGLGIPEGK